MRFELSGFGIAMIAMGVAVAMAGCNSPTHKVPRLDPVAASTQAMKELDTSGEGVLDPKELEKAPGAGRGAEVHRQRQRWDVVER